MTEEPTPAVVLFSGGLDSTTTLAIARSEGYAPHALTVDYGQRHRAEVEAARATVRRLGIAEHLEIQVGLDLIGGSALTSDLPVPAASDRIGEEIPVTYVPARNTVLLSLALAWAEVLGARDIFIGVNALDYSGYPDCRPAFIEAFERLANLATRAGVTEDSPFRIRAPLLSLTKAEIIRKGTDLGVDYTATVSCYDASPDGTACGLCEACVLRRRGFEAAGVPDPTRYRTGGGAD